MAMSWDDIMHAFHRSLLAADGTMSLGDAWRAWTDARATVVWARMAASVDPSHQVADPGALAAAAGREVALSARQLAAHHDHTLRYQLGQSAAQVAQIRDWARGTDMQLASALAAAQAASRPLQRSDLISGDPCAVLFGPLVAEGVTIPADPS